ncbi:hypothetical protein OAG51_02255 [Pirellulaceae bacterium]|nr:hypothetical protein [Pirellulaceae bacterium]
MKIICLLLVTTFSTFLVGCGDISFLGYDVGSQSCIEPDFDCYGCQDADQFSDDELEIRGLNEEGHYSCPCCTDQSSLPPIGSVKEGTCIKFATKSAGNH